MAESATIRLDGEKELFARLSRFNNRVRAGIMRKAVRAGSAPIRKASKSLAPKRSGRLAESMGIKVKQYKQNGNTVGIVGPREKFKSNSKSFKGQTIDAFYGHMVEGGTKPHIIRGPVVLNGKVYRNLNHPGQRAQRFMQKAATRAGGVAVQKFTAKLKTEIDKETANPTKPKVRSRG